MNGTQQGSGLQTALIVISGCSGGGKSTLLAELARRGYRIVAEPGCDIVREQIAVGGDGLPWIDFAKFAELCTRLAARRYRDAAAAPGPVFFDRSIIDAVSALRSLRHPIPDEIRVLETECRYYPTVFMAPPWGELFENDRERRHSFQDAVGEYERLCRAYPQHGYEVLHLPKTDVRKRADFVERAVKAGRAAR